MKELNWGVRLSKVLREKKMSQKAAAQIAGVRPSVMSGWLSGASPADFMKVKILCDHLGVGFTWLLTGQNEDSVSGGSIAEMFEERQYFDGFARVRIDHLVPRKPQK